MPEFLQFKIAGANIDPADIGLRLLISLVFGFAVASVYRHTRPASEITASFPTTLVLLCILIAMVTQVIGDNVARAFSLVGALSIVRFRTVVRDTRDTAFVIFSVVVGMAVGASNFWVATIGFMVVVSAASILASRKTGVAEAQPSYLLKLRVSLGLDPDEVVKNSGGKLVSTRELVSISTARQGIALDAVYEVRLTPGGNPRELLSGLNKIEGVQSVELERRDFED